MAAYSYTQNFDSLNTGDLNEQDSWEGPTTFDVETSVKFKGAKAVGIVGSDGSGSILRNITGVDSGDMYYATRISGAGYADDGNGILFFGSTDFAAQAGWLGFSDTGSGTYFQVRENGGWDALFAPTADAWYIIHINFINATTFKVQWKIAGGSFSAYTATKTWQSSVSSPACLLLSSGVATANITYYWDEIGTSDPDVAASGPANLKSYNTNLKANIKSINTNLIANVKTLNTNA